MSFKTRLSVLLLSTPVLAFVLVGGLLGNKAAARSTGDDKFQHLRVFEDVVSLVMSTYVEDVKVDEVMEGAMRGLADGLDPDSAYLTAAEVKSLEAPGCASAVPTPACAGTPTKPRFSSPWMRWTPH